MSCSIIYLLPENRCWTLEQFTLLPHKSSHGHHEYRYHCGGFMYKERYRNKKHIWDDGDTCGRPSGCGRHLSGCFHHWKYPSSSNSPVAYSTYYTRILAVGGQISYTLNVKRIVGWQRAKHCLSVLKTRALFRLCHSHMRKDTRLSTHTHVRVPEKPGYGHDHILSQPPDAICMIWWKASSVFHHSSTHNPKDSRLPHLHKCHVCVPEH